MRTLAAAACCLLVSANLAFAAPADRTALLDRLSLALPKFTEMVPLAEMLSGDKRRGLTARNPGKAAVIDPIAESYGACIARLLESRDSNAEAVAAADRAGMTEAQLLKVIAFYEDPAVKEFFASVGPALISGKEPEFDPEEFERITALMQDPDLEQFSQLIKQSSQNMMKDPTITSGLRACEVQLDKAVSAAGLTA